MNISHGPYFPIRIMDSSWPVYGAMVYAQESSCIHTEHVRQGHSQSGAARLGDLVATVSALATERIGRNFTPPSWELASLWHTNHN